VSYAFSGALKRWVVDMAYFLDPIKQKVGDVV
jgi:hypothetical protein